MDPAGGLTPAEQLLDVDRYMLARLAHVGDAVERHFGEYDFQSIFQTVNEFVTVDLSSFYLDVSKDRLYTFGADSVERRSAQTAQYLIADGLCRLIAPILSMTADEVWRQLPGTREPSVHLAEFAPLDQWLNSALEERWRRLVDLRAPVNLALEAARQRKEIGSALAAHVTISASGADADVLEQHRDQLPMLFIVSSVEVIRHDADDVAVEVSRAPGEKCPRCWRFVADRVPDGELAGLCERCVDAVGGMVASGH
jgi:isoleucyl-tRNA synthetase